MKGLILEIRGLHAIVLLPGGELRRVLRRRGWRTGMIVDPDAVRSGGFARAGAAIAMALVLMLGLGAYRILAPRSDVPAASSPNERVPLTLPGLEASLSAPPTVIPSPEVVLPAATGKHRDGDDDDYCAICDQYGHEADDNCAICGVHGHEDDDHCDFCGQLGHDDDDCPYAPPGWDDD